MTARIKKIPRFHPIVWALIGGTFITRTGFFMSWPFLTLALTGNHGLSATAAGAVLGTSALMGGVFGLYSGYLSDKLGRKALLISSLVLNTLIFLGLGTLEQSWMICGVALLAGIARSLYEPASQAYLSDLVKNPKEYGFVLNLRYVAINLGAAIGASTAVRFGLSAKTETFLITSLVFFTMLVIMSMLFKFFTESSHKNQKSLFSFKDSLSILKKEKSLSSFVTASALVLACFVTLDSILPLFLNSSIPEGKEIFSHILAINSILCVATPFVISRLLEGFKTITVAQISTCFMGMAMVAFAFGPTSNIFWYVGIVLLTLGEVAFFPRTAMFVEEIAPKGMKGTYLGCLSMMDAGAFLGPALGGMLFDHSGGQSSYLTFAGLCMVAGWFLLRSKKAKIQESSRGLPKSCPVT